jgi:hypothetical protein
MTEVSTYPVPSSSILNEDLQIFYAGKPTRLTSLTNVKETRYTVPAGKTALLRSVKVSNSDTFFDCYFYLAIYDSQITGINIYLAYCISVRANEEIEFDLWVPMSAGDQILCGWTLQSSSETSIYSYNDVIISGKVF